MIKSMLSYLNSFKLLKPMFRWLYTRSIVIDGNFSADHLKMRRPENDVALSPGGRYMVEPTRYQAHLEKAIDHREVSNIWSHPSSSKPDSVQKSTCSDHKAVNRVNLTQGHLQATGIGAVACARHGCFFPQSVVDFQKGERYFFESTLRDVLTRDLGR
jgi:hypothetical protein